MGGANALTTALRPDLRSATVQSTNLVDDTTTVRVCFSKAIASLPQAAFFKAGNYQDDDGADPITATSATRSTSNCADAVFPNSDSEQFTYITALGSLGAAPDSGLSAVATNGFGNIQDSTALIGSKTNNGTRGFTTGPDLVGITINNAAATIDYTYDQRVGAVSNLPTSFSYNLANGNPVDSIDGTIVPRQVSSDGKTVRVSFPPGPQIQGAVRATSNFGAVTPKNGVVGGDLRSAARPGTGGFTDRPDLVAVTLAPDGSFVDYQFDQVITVVGAAANFSITFSNAAAVGPGAAPAVVGGLGVGNTVRIPITFGTGGGTTYNELIVSGSTLAGAVTGAGGASTAGGLPAGGNAGAFASGFTVGPEALSVTFDNATDIARVVFDQRWNTDVDPLFTLIDDQGSQIAAAPINVSGGGAPTAGKTTAEITFPAGSVSGARSLLIQQSALSATVGSFENRPQVISPTAPAARTARKFRKAKKISAKQRAAMRRAAKRTR